MALVQSLISPDKYTLKCPYTMTPKGICIHNTANNASAENEIAYMKSNSNTTSFHIAVDDIQAIQGIPFNRNAWASGDGFNGDGNRNYIHLEICYSLGGGSKFDAAEKRAAVEVAALMKQYGWTIKNIKKHQDFAEKYCPHRTLDNGWDRFLRMIELELLKLNNNGKVEYDMKRIVVYYGDVDAFSAIMVSQKKGCPLMRLDHYKASGLKAEEVIQIGGKGDEPTRFDTFKNAGKLV